MCLITREVRDGMLHKTEPCTLYPGENICVFPTLGHLSQQITAEMTSVTSLVCGLGLSIQTKLGKLGQFLGKI